MAQVPISVAIVRYQDSWRVLTNGGAAGRYADRIDAERAALRFAMAAQGTGRTIKLLVQQAHGELRPFDE